jgi:4'-phosphopantetheinyl transferase
MTLAHRHTRADACVRERAPPPGARPLGDDEVHVWHASLDLAPHALERLESTLSPDERARAERLVHARDRRRFVAARGGARIILGAYVGRPAAALSFSYGVAGKPELVARPGDETVRFNYAHSGDRAIYAVRRRERIGVDLEATRALPELELLIRSVCSRGERAELAALPPHERRAAFFRGWTRKEAMVKALGDGLTRSAAGIEVRHGRSAERLLVTIDGDERAAAAWTLQALPAARGYVAALASEGGALRLSSWRLDAASLRQDEHHPGEESIGVLDERLVRGEHRLPAAHVTVDEVRDP